MYRFHTAVCVLGFCLLNTQAQSPASPSPAGDFTRDVLPIFTKHCLSCHGPDKQRGDLRLDRKPVPAILAKNDNPLLHRITSTDSEVQMPPKGERLSKVEIDTLKKWIAEGATWPEGAKPNPADWWSFKPITKPTPPKVPGATHPVDAFIRAKLADIKMSANPEADRRTLIRRLYFDLLGLPPTAEEVDAFVKDTADNAYEKLVDKLLESPHYGERWARHWLDVVHFGETHGYDKDKPRPNAWPYRDYVIRSFNKDKPYSRFVQEQIAGDALFPGTVDGIEALGFLAAGPWDFIAHVELPESKLDGKVARHLDRDDFVSNTISTFVGLTAHCAQCHNHKFDPISQEDYYRLQAVFAAIDRTDKSYDADPKIAAKRAELEKAHKLTELEKLQLESAAHRKAGPELARIEKQIQEALKPTNGKPPEFGYHSEIATKQATTKWVQVDLGESKKIDRVILRPCHDDFANIGAGFGFPVRFHIELSDDAEFKKSMRIAAEAEKDFPNPGLVPYSAKAEGKQARYIRVTATKLALRQNDYILALAELEALDADGKNLALKKTVTALDSIEAGPRWRKSNLTDGLFAPGPNLTDMALSQLKDKLAALKLKALGEAGVKELADLEAKLQHLDTELAKLSGSKRTAYIGAVHTGSGNFAGTGGKPRPIHILSRGEISKPGKEVTPGAITGIPGVKGDFDLPANPTEADRRVSLAKWITDKNHPLTWRVMANRVWQYHFGRGIVDTPNDFGKMGQPPTHPELLDFLASELREHQSIKKLHKLLVTSATYKQSSAHNTDFAKVDAENRFLWRQNRRKLDAEAVRDAILFVSGKLDLKAGGPSFQDFIIEKPEHSPHYQYHLYDPEDTKTHRRAVYRFTVRSKANPFMAALDCADPSLAVEKRNETLSPQQALALLNNKLTAAMAKHFAARVEKLAKDPAEQVRTALRLAVGRDPSAKEADAMRGYLKEHGLPNLCRVLLNLNEFVFVD